MGCTGVIAVSFILLVLLVLFAHQSHGKILAVDRLSKGAVQVFMGIVFWAVLLLLLSGSRK